MTVANIPVLIFIRQLPSNGIFRLNGLYALGFGTYCQIVLPKIVPVYIPPAVLERTTHPRQHWVFIFVNFIVDKWYILLLGVNFLGEVFLLMVR